MFRWLFRKKTKSEDHIQFLIKEVDKVGTLKMSKQAWIIQAHFPNASPDSWWFDPQDKKHHVLSVNLRTTIHTVKSLIEVVCCKGMDLKDCMNLTHAITKGIPYDAFIVDKYDKMIRVTVVHEKLNTTNTNQL